MSHRVQILNFLKANGSITPMQALNTFGCYRLGARILELRGQGYKILTEINREGRKIKSRYIYMGKG